MKVEIKKTSVEVYIILEIFCINNLVFLIRATVVFKKIKYLKTVTHRQVV